jgi:hypothetical protein
MGHTVQTTVPEKENAGISSVAGTWGISAIV